jgi:integrase
MLRKRRGHWHYRFQINGHKYSGNTGLEASERNRKAALQYANRKQEEAGKAPNETAIEETRVWFVDAVAQFLDWCEHVEYRQKPSTWKRIRVSFTSLMTFFHEKRASEITAGDIEQYKHWRLAELKVREITLRHDLHNFSVFVQYATKQRWIQSSPLEGVTIPSDADSLREHVLTQEEEGRYFARAFEIKDREGRRNLYDLGRLMILQGCRPEELMSLRKEHVNIEGRQIKIAGGKTRAARRTLDLCEESIKLLAARLGGDSPWVFPSDRRAGRPIGKLQGPHDLVCREACLSFVIYDLRHTFATRMIEAGVDVPTLAAILGHNGLRTIYRYVHPSEEHKRTAMAKFEAAQMRRKLRVV